MIGAIKRLAIVMIVIPLGALYSIFFIASLVLSIVLLPLSCIWWILTGDFKDPMKIPEFFVGEK